MKLAISSVVAQLSWFRVCDLTATPSKRRASWHCLQSRAVTVWRACPWRRETVAPSGGRGGGRRADPIESNLSWTKRLIFLLWKIQCYLDGKQGWGGLLARYVARLVTQKRTVILSCLWLLSLLKTDETIARTGNWIPRLFYDKFITFEQNFTRGSAAVLNIISRVMRLRAGSWDRLSFFGHHTLRSAQKCRYVSKNKTWLFPWSDVFSSSQEAWRWML